ncbi:hypothetical protein KY289_025062 [Solanum tuberosum]|nr:hypothetical protein KY289_025062 [Solanum tuberosum]
MVVLQDYEKQSGQKVNKEKSFYYLHQNVAARISTLVEQCTGMSRGSFPMKYLWCPITHTRKRKEHYDDLFERVRGKLHAWKGKMLPFGGKKNNTCGGNLEEVLLLCGMTTGPTLGPYTRLQQSDVHTCHPIRDIGELLTEKGWDFDALQDTLPEYVVEHIRVKMGSVKLGELGDKPWWTLSSTRKCCFIPVEETAEHLFLTGEVVPIVILWFLWKRRNTILYGGSYSERKLIWEINCIILKVIKVGFKSDTRSTNWHDIISDLQGHISSYSINIVKWIRPPTNWLKCNTDGAARGNPGPSSAAFCIRDYSGNMVVAKGFKLQDTSNLVVEAKAIREGLVAYPLECDFGGQLHKHVEEILISNRTIFLSGRKYSS